MEALLRAKGLWKCTRGLAQDFMTTLELFLSRRKMKSRPSSTKYSVFPRSNLNGDCSR